MNLRTRITLITCLGFSLLSVGLIIEGLIREQNVSRQLQQTRQDGVNNAWYGILDTEIQRLTYEIPALNRNPQALAAVTGQHVDAFQDAIRPLLLRFQTSVIATELVVSDLSGNVFFNTAESPSGHILRPEVIQTVIQRGGSVSGLFWRGPGDYVLATAFPLFSRVEPAGVAAFEVPVQPLLERLTDGTNAAYLLLDAAGVLAASTHPDLLDALTDGSDTVAPKLPSRIFLPPTATASDPYPGILRTRVISLMELRFPVVLAPRSRLVAAMDISEEFWPAKLASSLGYGLAGMSVLLFLALLYWYLKRAFGPLNSVIQVLDDLAAGNTQTVALSVPPSDDEIGRLARTVERFRQAQEARNQLQLIRQELEVATRIQSAIRPSEFPQRETFSLHAQIHTAQEMGGDFYDYFDLPDGRFAFTVADVSGKGIGAAMFMAVARTVLRTTAMILPAPQDCLARTNDFLCLDNQESMFVTVFYGVFDPRNGSLVYANAGHNPPYRISTAGHVTALAPTGGIALGVMPEFEFSQTALQLFPGEQLVLYTDGVTEAVNPAHEEFGNPALEQLLSEQHHADTPEALSQRVLDAVMAFADGAPQADDITLMALLLKPQTETKQSLTAIDRS